MNWRNKPRAAGEHGEKFIPCTREVPIGDGVVYRPVRMWHSGTYAGEGITSVRGDGSGCCRIVRDPYGERAVCDPPTAVVTRLYWNQSRPEDTVSAVLSYPNGLGIHDEYFWETFGTKSDGDIERFFGNDAESKMEAKLLSVLGDSARDTALATEVQKAREERPARLAEAKQLIRSTAEKLRAGKTLEQILVEADEDPFTLN